MGRMKDIYTDLQNQYGEKLENAPKGFSIDEHLEFLAKSKSCATKIALFGKSNVVLTDVKL